MELNYIRDTIGKTKGVDGYVVMDVNGAVMSQDLGPYANRIKRTEFATWILNCFYAIDSYYPQSFCVLLRYASGHLYLTRTDNRLITVMCRQGADILSIENAFSKHRQSMAKSDTSGIVREKSKKGETVFLKISETGEGATASPIPQKKSGPPVGAIIAIVIVLILVGAGVAFTLGGGKEETTPAPAIAEAKPASETTPAAAPAKPTEKQTASSAEITEATAEIARDRAEALAKIANQQNADNLDAMNMARALANKQSALQAFNAGNYEQANELWNESAISYGKAAVTASQTNFNDAIAQAGLEDIRNYPTQQWINIENEIKQAKQEAANGNYSTAVQSISSQKSKIPQIKSDLLSQLNSLASKAADNNNVPAALEYYQKVLQIDPASTTAQQYIYQNRFKPGEVMTNALGMKLAYAPPGKFNRGSPENEAFRDNDETQTAVTITKGYFIATTEVTQEQWQKVMGNRAKLDGVDAELVGATLPMHSITWEQANEFCERLSAMDNQTYRLPTEAEWEYAARAGTTTPYNNGSNRLTSRDANIYDPTGEGLDAIAAVGSVGNPNEWGLYDMHGNVAEWTADWSAPYPAGPQTDPAGPSETEGRVDLAMKIVRGGSFIDDAPLARSANRSEASPVVSTEYIGFRPVLVVSDL
ncbi:SUMF1/EgtB/PvdO family nonheme iron enzyme [Cerasicoccus fimbriatus]|uniref:SUMF1/EgtB/PvdO family nonheme iron enzyme n=1 Tax=Cerasicoccus fimbriatus TaxID=3014554 RepID=UPI0022B54B30|nr:SUMF1/EgtB/PvdO family nonheme iron enzyme [Cerasicoccus sp. TK19100]